MAEYTRFCKDCSSFFKFEFADDLGKDELFRLSYETPSPCCDTLNYRQGVPMPGRKGIINSGKTKVKNMTFEHIGPEPITVRDKAELKDKCQEHGVYSNALENGMFK